MRIKSILLTEHFLELGVEFSLVVEASYHIALGVNNELGGDVYDSIVVGILHGSIVDIVILLHAEFFLVCDILFPGLFAAVERYGYHFETLCIILVIDFLHMGQRSTAGTTPRSPEVEKNNLALEIGSAHGFTVLVVAAHYGSHGTRLDGFESGDILACAFCISLHLGSERIVDSLEAVELHIGALTVKKANRHV